MRKIGLAFDGGLEHTQIPPLAKLAESNGFESAWFAEGLGGDAFALAAACARATTNIKLGTSVVSVFTRSPTIIAMASATVNALSGGRFILGLGSSHRVQVQGEHGLAYAKPMERVVETVEIVRKALAQGKVSYSGKIFGIKGFEFWFKQHDGMVPIYLSAVFEKMLRKVGEVGDGVILTTSSVDQIRKSIAHVREGARNANRDPTQIRIADYVPCCASEDVEKAKRVMRRYVAAMLGYFPRYSRQAADAGFEAEVKRIREHWLRGDINGACEPISDQLLDSVSLVGQVDECRSRVDELIKAGIELPILFYHPTGDDPRAELDAFIRSMAQ